MLNVIHKSNNPAFLVITPLRLTDSISTDTLKIIKNTTTEFDWISFSGNNNIPTNTQLGLLEYEKTHKPLKYIIKVDNDISASYGWLDMLYETLNNTADNIAYCYCSFAFTNINKKISFKAREFNIQELLKSNYISSVSMIKRNALHKVGNFVCDEKYVRLLDYALWLKFLQYDFIRNT